MSLTAYNRIGVAGVEVQNSDPITNLFPGRTYFNSSVDQFRVYNGGTWVSFGATYSPYTKRVGPGEAYTTLAAVAAAAVPGDWILVTGDTTDTADVDFNTSEIHIDWSPNAKSTFNGGSHTNILTFSGNRIKTNRMHVTFSPTTGVTKGLYVSGAGSVVDGTVWFFTAQAYSQGVHVDTNLCHVRLTLLNLGGATFTNVLLDNGVNSIQTVGPL